MEKLFQDVGASVVLGVWVVVRAAVGEDACHVGLEDMLVDVVPVLQPFRHSLQICYDRNWLKVKLTHLLIHLYRYSTEVLLTSLYRYSTATTQDDAFLHCET